MTKPASKSASRPQQIELSCGAQLAVERIPGVRSVGVSWLIPAGDAFDPETRLGRAPMLAELLLRGAAERDSRAQADAYDRAGVSRGVDNGRSYVRASATMLGERLGDGLNLLAESVLEPRMEPDSVDAARELALQALASLPDDPQQRATLLARSRHHPEPLNRSGYGTAEGLRALTRDELRDGWSDAAKPRGSIIAIAGDVEADEAANHLESLLSSWSGAAPWYDRGPAPQRGYAHEQDDSAQVQALIVHDAPSANDPMCPAAKVLGAVLSGGMSGRLFTEVREKRGLCYSVNASYAAERDTGTVTAYVGTTPDRAQEAVDVLHDELTGIGRTRPVERDEFDRAVEGLKSRIVFGGESTSARAGALAGDIHRLGRARSLEEVTAEIESVTLDGLNDYAASRDLGTITVQTLGPTGVNPPA